MQEEFVIALRQTLWLSLDELLMVAREFVCDKLSRSALQRLLTRYGVSRLPREDKPVRAHKPFKAYEPGYLHIEVKYLPQMADELCAQYLFVAIDRATRWVFVQLKPNKSAACAKNFLAELRQACPAKISKILTDNGREFTNRLFGGRQCRATGLYEFDQLCQALGIEHRLTRPRSPQTNGMLERFNGRISQVLATHHFDCAQTLAQTLNRYVWIYNHHLPQKNLKHLTPMLTMKHGYDQHSGVFHSKPRNYPAPDK